MDVVYLNGEYLPPEQAKVSIFDRGFLFGDGVYEVVPIFNGKMFGLDEHLHRLDRSLNAIELIPPLSHDEWKSIFTELLARNGKTDGNHNIYLQITRGAGTTRDHAIPKDIKPTILAFCTAAKIASSKHLNKGHSAITLKDTRRLDCWIKAINLLPNILAYETAKRAGAHEAILIRDGFALEGTSSNLFVIKNNEIFTPPLSNYILGGITRDLLIRLARENHISCFEQDIEQARLFDADEIWLTGSSKEIYAITNLNGKPVGSGEISSMWKRMMEIYEVQKSQASKKA